MPEFFNQSHKANKYVIVGHWPVVNYSEEAPSNNPVIDKEKKLLQLMEEMQLKSRAIKRIYYSEETNGRYVFLYICRLFSRVRSNSGF